MNYGKKWLETNKVLVTKEAKPMAEELDREWKEQKQYDRCLRCGRKLKTTENRLRGYGKICWEKIIIKNSKKLFTFAIICVILL